MSNIDQEPLAHEIANAWTNALLQECREQFGEDEAAEVSISIICAAYAWAMTRPIPMRLQRY